MKGKRLVFFGDESKEAVANPAVPEAETIERRKIDARSVIDEIYELGKYNTYDFRKLPQEFKDRMKVNFGQWIDSNIAGYDKDKNSGIDAREYGEFKQKLNEKVQEILDRLIELKEKKKKEAEAVKETAEQARERQKRLEGVDAAKLDVANLDSADGIYTELLKYQKDFEKEAEGFAALAGKFTDVKEQAESANKSHYTGATALGEYLVSLAPWADDIPEVKAAKEAKEKAVEDFRAKLSEMKMRQKDRAKRGQSLNGAPEKAKKDTTDKYEEKKKEVKEGQEKVAASLAENARRKKDLQGRVDQVNDTRKKLQEQHDKVMVRLAAAQKQREEAGERTKEMEQAVRGLELEQRSLESKKGMMSEEKEKVTAAKLGETKAKTGDARKQLRTGLGTADMQITGLGQTVLVMQRQMISLDRNRDSSLKGISDCDKAEALDSAKSIELTKLAGDLDKEEQQQVEQIDGLDEAIATTVLEVDTANFELVKKGDEYFKMLNGLSISGPGLIDMVGASLKGIPGVETAYNWTGDKLAAGWKWAKEAPFLGAAIQIVGYMGEGWVKAWDAIGDGLSWVGDKLQLQDFWDYIGDASKRWEKWNWLGPVTSWAGGLAGTVVEVIAGVTEGAKDLVKGIGMMVRNPIDMIKGIGALVNHPGMIIDALIQKDKWAEEGSGKIIGRMLFDTLTAMTGVGATVTGVKTALAAVNIGRMSVGKAILLGIEMFGRTVARDAVAFFKYLPKLPGILIRLPKNLMRGAADLVNFIASGGKRVETAEEAARKAAAAANAEKAYKAVEAVRGKPAEFANLVRKNPHIMDLHGRHLKNVKRAEDEAAKAAREAESANKKELAAPPFTINNHVLKPGDKVKSPFKEGEIAYVRWNEGKYYLAREPLGVPFDARMAFTLPTEKRLAAAAKRQTAEAILAAKQARAAEARKLADAKKMAETAPLVKRLEDTARQARKAGEAHVREALGAALAKANYRGTFDMDRAVKQVMESVGRKIDKAIEEAKCSNDPKAITRATRDMDGLVKTVTERHAENYLSRHGLTVPEGAVTASKAVEEIPKPVNAAAEVAGGMPVPAKVDFQPKVMTPERKALIERVEAGGRDSGEAINKLRLRLGTVKGKGYEDLLKALPTEDLKMLSGNLHNLDTPWLEKIFKQEYFILETEGKSVRYYIGKSISEQGGFGMVSECLYLEEGGKVLKDGAVKMPFKPETMAAELEKLRELKNLTDDQRHRMAQINEFLQNWQYAFKMDLETNMAAAGMPEVPHLLRAVALPKAGKPYAFIFPRIKPRAGMPDVGLNWLFENADVPPENILLAGEQMAEAADGILARGFLPTDLKPGNVFVGTIDGVEVTQLGDLGLTRFEDVSKLKITGTIKRFPLYHYERFAKESLGKKPGEIPLAVRDRPVVGHMYKSFEKQFEFFTANPQLFPPSSRGEVLKGLDALMERMKDVNDTITISEVRLEFRRLRELVEGSKLLKAA